MIKLRGKTEANDINNKIIFEPRPGFTRGRYTTPTLEFPLIYGHRCSYCSNVMQALFKAPRTFNLWPYEETSVLSQGEKNSGELLKVFPDDKTKFGKSCYRTDFSPCEGGSVKLTLCNHICKHRAIAERQFDGTGLWEEGHEKPCTHTGIFSLREDLLVKDWLLFAKTEPFEVVKYNIPSVKQLIKEDNPYFKLALAVGIAPPVILVEKQTLVYGFNYRTRPMMDAYKKAGQ